MLSGRLHPMTVKQCCLENEALCKVDASFAVDVEWNGTNEITLLVKKGWSYLWSKWIMTEELVSFCLWYHSLQASETSATQFCIMCTSFPGILKLGLSGLFPNSRVRILVTDLREFCPEHLQICRLLNCPERLTPNVSGQFLLLIILSSICCLQTSKMLSGLSVPCENKSVTISAVFRYYSDEYHRKTQEI